MAAASTTRRPTRRISAATSSIEDWRRRWRRRSQSPPERPSAPEPCSKDCPAAGASLERWRAGPEARDRSLRPAAAPPAPDSIIARGVQVRASSRLDGGRVARALGWGVRDPPRSIAGARRDRARPEPPLYRLLSAGRDRDRHLAHLPAGRCALAPGPRLDGGRRAHRSDPHLAGRAAALLGSAHGRSPGEPRARLDLPQRAVHADARLFPAHRVLRVPAVERDLLAPPARRRREPHAAAARLVAGLLGADRDGPRHRRHELRDRRAAAVDRAGLRAPLNGADA